MPQSTRNHAGGGVQRANEGSPAKRPIQLGTLYNILSQINATGDFLGKHLPRGAAVPAPAGATDRAKNIV